MSSKDKKPSSSGPTIRTLADLRRKPAPAMSDSDSDDPQEYYAGGEKSGMLVQDPSRSHPDPDAIFDQARQRAVADVPYEENSTSSSSRSFTGVGRLLSGETVPTAPQQPENILHTVSFWTNGFTINDGPLRRFDDPENASFLESIKKSECPQELTPADRRSTVNVNLVRQGLEFPEPEKPRVKFQGVGRTLGSGSSSVPESPASVTRSAVGLSVDGSLPSTSVQLRLADGTRMVARFNYRHTVGDIRAFIDSSRPGAARNYQLQAVGFPPKQLNNVAMTIEEAGLANSVVIQKL